MNRFAMPTRQRRSLPVLIREVPGFGVLRSSWVLGILVAVTTWRLSFLPPSIGLDPSWWAGLFMGAHRGIHFGSQLVFTYGPLGFLELPWLWYSDLAVMAFVYQAMLFIALAVSLVFALRRALNISLALPVAFLVLNFAQVMDRPVALAGIWCLAALSVEPPRFAEPLVIFGGAVLGACETLIEFRPGPVILVMCAITLIGANRWRRDLLLFFATALVATTVLWLSAGQRPSDFPEFVQNSLQIISGYSQAMGIPGVSRLYLIGELLVLVLLVSAAAVSVGTRRRRVAAAAVIGVAAFSVYKEATVRADIGHTAIFFGTAACLLVAVSCRHRRWLVLLALAAISLVNIQLNDDYALLASRYNPISNIRQASDQFQLLFDPQSRASMSLFSLLVMRQQYNVSHPMLNLLKARTVAVEPWEAAVAWTYRLDWKPLPVLQDYSAYTTTLDRLDADALRSAGAPQRILRENPPLVDYQAHAATIDGRFTGWDPPETYLAMLCNYVPLLTDLRWQVLGKAPDRCRPPRLIASVHTRSGAEVSVPVPPPRTVVYAKIDGAGVSGLENIRALLYRARIRYAIVNATHRFRLVPGTSGDGLLVRAARGIDYPAPFALSPAASTIKLTGTSGDLRVNFYSMPIARR